MLKVQPTAEVGSLTTETESMVLAFLEVLAALPGRCSKSISHPTGLGNAENWAIWFLSFLLTENK